MRKRILHNLQKLGEADKEMQETHRLRRVNAASPAFTRQSLSENPAQKLALPLTPCTGEAQQQNRDGQK